MGSRSAERGGLYCPYHDVNVWRKTRAARCPSAVSVLFLILYLRYWGHWAGLWDSAEPGVFAFLDCYQIGWHPRWSNDLRKARRDIRGKEVTNQENTASCQTLGVQQLTRQHVALVRRLRHQSSNNNNHGLCHFSCSFGIGMGYDISAFLVLSQALKVYKEAWSRDRKHNNQTEQDGRSPYRQVSTTLKRAWPHHSSFCRKQRHMNSDGHGWNGARNNLGKCLHGCL